MSLLFSILLATTLAGVGSVLLAALLSFGPLGNYTQHMLSLAAGTLLGTAFISLLPEAFEYLQIAHYTAHTLFLVLLLGLVFFFLLDKAQLWHHGHEHAHTHEQHAHFAHVHHEYARTNASWSLLLGDTVHAFGDGVLIASAFMTELKLGFATAFAILIHEMPHHMGDLVVVLQNSKNRRNATLKVALSGASTAIGGLSGYALLTHFDAILPFSLTLAASSFIYVALADLIPQLQRHLNLKQTSIQIFWLSTGLFAIFLVSKLTAHSHV